MTTTDKNSVKVDIKMQPSATVKVTKTQSATLNLIAGAGGGSRSGDKSFIFTQASPSKIWTIEHGLAKYPSVSVVDSANNIVVGDVQYISESKISISFAGAFSGKAYLN